MLILFFVLAIVLQGAFGQILSYGKGCAEPDVVQNFNASRYVGIWYEYEKYPIIFEIGAKCITANYTANDDGSVEVINSELFLGLINIDIKGKAVLASTTGEAKLTVTFDIPFAVSSPYWVLATNYTDYAVVFACESFLGISATTVWILTREANPSDSIIETAYEVLVDKGISTSYLEKTKQNCK